MEVHQAAIMQPITSKRCVFDFSNAYLGSKSMKASKSDRLVLMLVILAVLGYFMVNDISSKNQHTTEISGR